MNYNYRNLSKILTQRNLSCPEGTYCPNSTPLRTIDCPVGYYCPTFGAFNPIICPEGTYCPNTKMKTVINCPAGTYCPGAGRTKTLNCPTGYYCPIKSSKALPCPKGSYPNPEKSNCTNLFAKINNLTIQEFFKNVQNNTFVYVDPEDSSKKNNISFGWGDLIVITDDIKFTRELYDNPKNEKFILDSTYPIAFYKASTYVGFSYGIDLSFRICFTSPTNYWLCNPGGDVNNNITLENDDTKSTRINGTSFRYILYPPGYFISNGPFVMVLEDYANNDK